MNRTFVTLALPALAVLSFTPAQASWHAKPETPVAQARATLLDIEATSSQIANTAFILSQEARGSNFDPQAQSGRWNELKANVNHIGKQLQMLDEERASLAPWEVKALDKVIPEMRDAAANANQAIDVFNSDRAHLWASAYPEELNKIYSDASQTASTIKEFHKLAKTRQQEQRLQNELGNDTGF